MTDPSFSIVIPTYQRRELVCATIRSLAALSYSRPFDVIVVVDGATDGTATALAKLDCPFPLRIIEQENRGAAHARNRGAREAKGDIILFLDDDMVCAPDLLQHHARLYREGADAITGGITPDREVPKNVPPADLPKFAWSDPERPATAFDTFTGQLSVKRQVFEELGGFDESYTAAGGYGNEDLDFGARLLAKHRLMINYAAVSLHRDSASAAQVLRRARLLADADVRFAQRHPELAEELFELRGGSARATRLIYRPISRTPVLAPLVAGAAIAAAKIGLRTPFRSSRGVARLCSIAFGASYWSAVASRLRLLRSAELR